MQWAEMGERERLFAAVMSVHAGKSLAFAGEFATYDPETDSIRFVAAFRLPNIAEAKIDKTPEQCIALIRGWFPGWFRDDETVRHAVNTVGDKP